METIFRRVILKKTPRRIHGALSGMGMLDPNENQESLPEMLLVHDIADAFVPLPWAHARFGNIQLMEPTAQMHHDADGHGLNENIEAHDHMIPTLVVESDTSTHVRLWCSGGKSCGHVDDARRYNR